MEALVATSKVGKKKEKNIWVNNFSGRRLGISNAGNNSCIRLATKFLHKHLLECGAVSLWNPDPSTTTILMISRYERNVGLANNGPWVLPTGRRWPTLAPSRRQAALRPAV